MEIRAICGPWHDGVEFLIRDFSGSKRAVVKNITLENVEPGEFQAPTLMLTKTAAQVLMDDLWSSGLRPTEGSGSAGSLRATEKHLDDMRRIVEKKLGISLGNKAA